MSTTAPDLVKVELGPGRSMHIRPENHTTQAELVALLRERFGADPLGWAFTCPSCGDVATGADFREALATHPRKRRDGSAATASDFLGQECIGRTIGALTGERGTWAGRGCDWCAYGMFGGPLTVAMPDGGVMLTFRPADTVPAHRPALDVKHYPVRRLKRGERVKTCGGYRAEVVIAARDYRCGDDDCRKLIAAGTEHEVHVYMPSSEACTDFGVKPWSRYRMCEKHRERYGVEVIDRGEAGIEATR